MRVLPCGDSALLVETPAALGLYAALADPMPAGVTDLVPASGTLLVRFDRSVVSCGELTRLLTEAEPVAPAKGSDELVEVPVRYDGEDLAEVAARTGLGEAGVVEAHSRADYVVAFSGFAPGFGYLTGLDPRLHLPRRDTPRVRVPAGSVGVAGEFSGVYPRSSPGGWHLLGRTTLPMWDPGRTPPALLRPGTRVRFVPVDSLDPVPPAATAPPAAAVGGIEIVQCGPLTTVQDQGRPGFAALGVGSSGAADRSSAALANRLVGNGEHAAVLELTVGGAVLAFRETARVVVTGAPCPLTRNGRGEAMNAPFVVPAGQRLTIGAPVTGLRSYLAVRGGIDVAPTLGSRSTDVLSGLGPPVPSPGDVLPIGTDHGGPPPAVEVAPVPAPESGDLVVTVIPGPRADWFTPGSIDTLCRGRYLVTPESNRVGIRLDGPPLTRAAERELSSEGMVAGALQVPPSGLPVLFLADHPVTGGYPVIAVICVDDIAKAAQARPGQAIRFRIAQRPAAR